VRDSIGDFISIGINHLTLQLRASELLAFERSACAKEILNLFGSVEISIVVDDDFALGGDLFASDMLNERNTTIYFEPDVERERFGWFADQQHIMPGTDIKVSELRRDDIDPLFNALVLTSTENCNAACRHCAPSCAPVKSKPIDVNFFASIIRQASQNPYIKRDVAFVGGEPTIYLKELTHLFKVSNECGVTPSITTNGWWGRDQNKRTQYMEAFRRGGLRRMELSVDVFHQEFVPMSAIIGILKDARKYEISIIIRATINRVDNLSKALTGIPISLLKGHLVASSPVIPIGRAAEVIADEHNYKTNQLLGACHDALNFTVRYDGVATPCCVGTEFVPYLHLGNARQEPVALLVERFRSSFVLQNLVRLGPRYLVSILPDELRSKYENREFVGICHLCLSMFADDEIQQHFRKLESNVITNVVAEMAFELPSELLESTRARTH
jgi:hypothetical protein